jgi:chromosome condensin MukBEF ATPase and DNA-binding subunit MukB
MKKWLVAALIVVAGAAQAAAPKPSPPGDMPPERRAHLEQRARLMLTLQVADALELDDAATLKLKDQITRWDAQRSPLRNELMEQAQVLRRASRGDTTAYGQVDAAIKRIIDLRTQLQQTDQAMFQQLSQGLPPQKKAKLALVVAHSLEQMREMVLGGRGGRGGGGPDDGQ